MKPRYGRTDANHAEMVKCFQDLGCTVVDLSQVGGGMLDLLIGCVGVDCIVEVKTEDGELRTCQENFIARWRGRMPAVVRTQQDCVELVTKIRRGERK